MEVDIHFYDNSYHNRILGILFVLMTTYLVTWKWTGIFKVANRFYHQRQSIGGMNSFLRSTKQLAAGKV